VSRRYRIIETEAAFSDYIRIAEHIARWTEDWSLADRTVDAIRDYIKGMCDTPHRGTKRDDIRSGLRIVPFRKRAAIALEINEATRTVAILRVFYGGEDYETVLRARRR